ncbi:MAG: DUF47 family protein [Candidatus Korarchaeota archaeon]|nr:DUF47 family protein [Candidatus Korarchaeota archaeon]
MADRYMDYFRRSASSSILESVADLALKGRDAARELARVVEALESAGSSAVESGVERISSIEEEGDFLRRQILARLSRSEVPARDAEMLARLARRTDLIIDQIKNTALAIRVALEAGGVVPEDLRRTLADMVGRLAEETGAVAAAIRSVDSSLEDARAQIERVESIEHEIDLLYYQAKGRLPESGSVRFAILLNDVINEVEYAADLCEDATDVLSVLVVRLSLPGEVP